MTSANPIPYIGSKISLISNIGLRYDGILSDINQAQSTVGLSHVRCMGTEDRNLGVPPIGPSDDIFELVVFRGKDIRDLTVTEPAPPNDPAIVAVNQVPTSQQPVTTRAAQGTGDLGGDPQLMHRHMGGPQASRLGDQSVSPYLMGHGMPPTRMMGGGGTDHYGVRHGNMYVGVDSGRNPDYGDHMGGRRGGGHYNSHMGGMFQVPSKRGGGYGGHRGRGGGGYRHIVGELVPHLNKSLKSRVEESFNFEEANSKFDKASIAQETCAEGKENKTGGQDGVGSDLPQIKSVYDKKSSFFDSISCETLDRQLGHEVKMDRAKQRELDTETFGPEAAQIRTGRGGGRMIRRGGRGGGMGGYHRRSGNPSSMMGGVSGSHMGMGYPHMQADIGGFQYGSSRY